MSGCGRARQQTKRTLLWKANLGGNVASGPIAFAVSGRQHVAVCADGALYVFGLPE